MTGKASAPGKLVIAGEYAVLDGAPALVMAVNRRVTVQVPGTKEMTDSALYDAVTSSLDRGTGGATFDTDAFFARASDGSRRKLGLGSSAALTAALCRLLMPATADILRTAISAHRHFQAGSGSGVDVAASVVGGLLSYRMQDSVVTPLDWPAGLAYAVWWSGVASSTPAKLARYARADTSTARDDLAAAAGRLAAAWQDGTRDDLLCLLAAYVLALEAFDGTENLGVFAAGHGELARYARDLGLVYKPCGAGGGDVGMALAADDALLDEFAAVATRHGFTPLDLAIDHVGVRREPVA